MAQPILVFLESRSGVIHKSSWQAVSKAHSLAQGGDVMGVALGAAVASQAPQAGAYGVAKVLHVAASELDVFSAEAYSRVLAQVVQNHNARAILLPATAMGKDLAPRVAARLGQPVVADVTGLEIEGDGFRAKRPVYAGKLLADVQIPCTPAVISLRPNAFSATEVGTSAAAIEAIHVEIGPMRDRVVEVRQAAGGRLDVAEADIIVSGGRGLGNNETYEKLILPLAQVLGAANGASRAIVDAGWRPHGEQVGQTGKTVSPRLYIAVGISGAIQHKAGMDSSKCIVAINKDKDAPIFKFADYGIIGDANEVVPALTEKLRSFVG